MEARRVTIHLIGRWGLDSKGEESAHCLYRGVYSKEVRGCDALAVEALVLLEAHGGKDQVGEHQKHEDMLRSPTPCNLPMHRKAHRKRRETHEKRQAVRFTMCIVISNVEPSP